MASLYKRGEQFWISYKLNGRRVQQALDTSNERIARDKKRQIEYELTTGCPYRIFHPPWFGL